MERTFFFLSLANLLLYFIKEKKKLKDSEFQVKGINGAPSETELFAASATDSQVSSTSTPISLFVPQFLYVLKGTLER